MGSFTTIMNSSELLIIVGKVSILDVPGGSGYATDILIRSIKICFCMNGFHIGFRVFTYCIYFRIFFLKSSGMLSQIRRGKTFW